MNIVLISNTSVLSNNAKTMPLSAEAALENGLIAAADCVVVEVPLGLCTERAIVQAAETIRLVKERRLAAGQTLPVCLTKRSGGDGVIEALKHEGIPIVPIEPHFVGQRGTNKIIGYMTLSSALAEMETVKRPAKSEKIRKTRQPAAVRKKKKYQRKYIAVPPELKQKTGPKPQISIIYINEARIEMPTRGAKLLQLVYQEPTNAHVAYYRITGQRDPGPEARALPDTSERLSDRMDQLLYELRLVLRPEGYDIDVKAGTKEEPGAVYSWTGPPIVFGEENIANPQPRIRKPTAPSQRPAGAQAAAPAPGN